MAESYSKIHENFKFNGQHFNAEEFKEVAISLVKRGKSFEKSIGEFLIDWLNPEPYIFVNTSGSTGTPKRIKLLKKAMVNSALATGQFFNLKPKDNIVNCLPSHYIAGKMMLVRAMVLGLEIDCVSPSTNPIFDATKIYDFSAMVPLQVSNSIANLSNIKTIIIGGSQVSNSLKQQLENSNICFYETYGMTETVTHVALKPLQSLAQNGEDYFKALPYVSFSQDARDCLVINAPNIIDAPLTTNDIVDLQSETTFKWLGRIDNVINSGGVKLFPEQIEAKLQLLIKERFFVTSQQDETLGEKLILVVENLQEDLTLLLSIIKNADAVSKYEIPKEIYSIDQFIETSSGKIQRQKTLDLLFS